MSNATGCANWLRSLIVAASVAVILLGSAAALSGCLDLAPAYAARSDALALRTHLDQRLDDNAALLASLESRGTPPTTPELVEARRTLASDQARRDQIDALIQHLDELMAQAQSDTTATNSTLPGTIIPDPTSILSQTLPEPLRSPILLGSAALVALMRAAQLKRALASVTRAIDAAMKQDPEFKDKFLQHAHTFRTMQTATARRVIDELKRPPAIRIPL
jgi:hypothetical protein